jgi:hypothetical protein
MTPEYTWNFVGIRVKPLSESLENVVVSYEWRRGLQDGDHYVDVYGSLSLEKSKSESEPDPEPNTDNFTDFENLSKQDFINWTVAALTQETIDNYDASLAAQMENIKNPPVVVKPAPWQNENSVV